MSEAEILAMTYFDTCIISRLEDAEDPDTGLTEQNYQDVYAGVKCALSQSGLGSTGNLAVVENTGNVNVTYEDQKLFLTPDLIVKKGDRIAVTQQNGFTNTFYAKKPFYYPSHLEINLTGREIDG